MDFKEYREILEAEGLKESPLADGILIDAVQLEQQIKVLNKYNSVDDAIKKLNERKIACIWTAIDLSRMYKEDEELKVFIQQQFSKEEGHEHKGFIDEFRLMKEKK